MLVSWRKTSKQVKRELQLAVLGCLRGLQWCLVCFACRSRQEAYCQCPYVPLIMSMTHTRPYFPVSQLHQQRPSLWRTAVYYTQTGFLTSTFTMFTNNCSPCIRYNMWVPSGVLTQCLTAACCQKCCLTCRTFCRSACCIWGSTTKSLGLDTDAEAVPLSDGSVPDFCSWSCPSEVPGCSTSANCPSS